MCFQFYAKSISVLTADAIMAMHGGMSCANPDFPKGKIVCEDMHGNLYHWVDAASDAPLDPDCWPDKTEQGIRLWRDYWNAITPSPGAPYYDSIVNAPKQVIK